MSDGRYSVAETLNGWRVVERNNNGERILQQVFRSEASARRRAHQLTAQWLEREACVAVRKRSGNRCECLGECDRGHRARCGNRHGQHERIPGGAAVVLAVVALNHNKADVRLENLRGYCQLCKAYHDADEAGMDPLFTIGATHGS